MTAVDLKRAIIETTKVSQHTLINVNMVMWTIYRKREIVCSRDYTNYTLLSQYSHVLYVLTYSIIFLDTRRTCYCRLVDYTVKHVYTNQPFNKWLTLYAIWSVLTVFIIICARSDIHLRMRADICVHMRVFLSCYIDSVRAIFSQYLQSCTIQGLEQVLIITNSGNRQMIADSRCTQVGLVKHKGHGHAECRGFGGTQEDMVTDLFSYNTI